MTLVTPANEAVVLDEVAIGSYASCRLLHDMSDDRSRKGRLQKFLLQKQSPFLG